MKAFLRLKMDRPINKELHYISPGGYEFETADGKIYGMDFAYSQGCIDIKEPTTIEFTLKNMRTMNLFPKWQNSAIN